ncbi:cyclic AMP-responsive element-binding protein 3-like protein 2 isoform X2 [Centruroides vittatus]|uniref:cyclic AMP-responsive element-binding protein 3-like protein 2 isoform X2 n=1 Tax=Centruroides vittatus TaxID=120091 RepID=UPI00350F5B7E
MTPVRELARRTFSPFLSWHRVVVSPSVENFAEMNVDSEADWSDILDNNQQIVLNDRMMTDAVQSPHIQTEHSYSLTLNEEMPQSPFAIQSRLEEYGKDMDTDCFPSVTDQSDFPDEVVIKREPPSPSSPTPPPPLPPETKPVPAASSSTESPSVAAVHPNSLLKQPTIVLAGRPGSGSTHKPKEPCMTVPKVSIKLEPLVAATTFALPPTPPSSNGSDSDGSLSPVHAGSHPPSPSAPPPNGSTSNRRNQLHPKFVVSLASSRSPGRVESGLISSQPKGATGVLVLTDEEKRTLLAEGYPIPQHLPLTKAEERSLKKVRRKIKNKISAQESRRKKKEYMDALERKVETLSRENGEFKKRIEVLEGNNKSLLCQLKNLQTLIGESSQKTCKSTSIQLSNQSLEIQNQIKEERDISSCSDLREVTKITGR